MTMPDAETAPVPEIATARRGIERRAYVRLAVDLAAVCRPPNHLSHIGWPGQVRDVSQGGVGLVTRHRFQPGTRLSVDLRSATGAPLRTVGVKVIHATASEVGGSPCWLLGCAFDAPLADEVFQSLQGD
jgi:hypothetical protein